MNIRLNASDGWIFPVTGQTYLCKINGVDITDLCCAANPRAGLAVCFVKNDFGQLAIDESGKDLERVLLAGKVMLKPIIPVESLANIPCEIGSAADL